MYMRLPSRYHSINGTEQTAWAAILSALGVAVGVLGKVFWESWRNREPRPDRDENRHAPLREDHKKILYRLDRQDHVVEANHRELVDTMKDLTEAINNLRVEMARLR